jgi:hypothetical protein
MKPKYTHKKAAIRKNKKKKKKKKKNNQTQKERPKTQPQDLSCPSKISYPIPEVTGTKGRRLPLAGVLVYNHIAAG